MNLPSKPIFVGDPAEWRANILAYGMPLTRPVSPRAHAIAVAVFRAAAVWNQMFWAPADFQVSVWAELFDRPDLDWLTIDLAERAVNEHFRAAIVGHMVPGHVIQRAAVLLLEQEAQS